MSETSLPLVLITNEPPAACYESLHGVAKVLTGRPVGQPLMSREEVLELAPKLSGIINQAELAVDEEFLSVASQLKIVANVAIGVDNLNLELMESRGVWATNAPEAFTDATADATMALLLAVGRRISEADRYVRQGRWIKDGFMPGVFDGMQLSGKTLGLIGFGRIGQAVAKRAQAFGMTVCYHDRFDDQTGRLKSLDDLLSQADVLSLHLPLTDKTRGLINAESLAKCKRGALLLNLSRGKVVDEEALVDALETGQLAGAGLDVFQFEPAVNPALIQMDNVVLTPHLGGATDAARHAARSLAARNVAEVLQGRAPLTPVNDVR